MSGKGSEQFCGSFVSVSFFLLDEMKRNRDNKISSSFGAIISPPPDHELHRCRPKKISEAPTERTSSAPNLYFGYPAKPELSPMEIDQKGEQGQKWNDFRMKRIPEFSLDPPSSSEKGGPG